MRLWERASAILKDNNSICLAKLSRRTSFRNPDLESALIKATSHDELSVDYKNTQRVFAWVRTSSSFIKPFIWALTKRMEKTRSWIVVIKGLMLLHGIFCCNVPALRRIGRLPFDLSNFTDGHSKSAQSWGFNAFVRAYFAYLDKRSFFLSCDAPLDDLKDEKDVDVSMVKVLVELQRLQTLLDMLIQIKPRAAGMNVCLILEAMDCIVIEIFDIYSRTCRGIAGVLLGIFNAGKVEASMALRVLQKAASQGEELSLYFEFCKDFGVLNASEFPRVEQIPEEDIRVLEQMINGKVSEKKINESYNGDEKAIVPVDNPSAEKQEDLDNTSKTIVTQNWVVFDDEFKAKEGADEFSFFGVDGVRKTTNYIDPFAASLNCPPLLSGNNSGSTIVSSNGFLELEHYFNPIPAAASTVGNQSNWIVPL
ncbi:putative clathrin assembly protein At1g25240 [Telopea speciosissima]|uniref:putative clathrin assembly protein At1g25240 n=1 Tax=Telopea speciosissima TaxID=54955 RepID=UPI001CC81CD6|nr:putative clathrin assembly protein At1g25240 [Telopea speciosissima]